MRLAWKLVLALVLGLTAVLALSGVLRVQREMEVFEHDMRRDHEAVARVLEPSLVDAFRRGGDAEMERLLRQSAGNERLTLRLLDPVDRPVEAAPDWRSHVFPVRLEGRTLAALEITERRDEEQAFLHATMMRTGLTTAALLSMATVVVMVFSFVLVGRPVRLLRAKTRRIASGDLTGSLRLTQRDEIGDLGRDIDKMCDDLAAARQRAEEESLARGRALEQLRHADRLASVGTLASGLAHELGTPLGVVLARARLIEEDAGQPAATLSSARTIADQVERMSRIIRQLLDFARRGRNSAELEPDVVDLRSVARTVAALLQPMAAKQRIELVVQPDGEGRGPAPRVRGENALLQQVVLNLVMNAVQAMGEQDLAGKVQIGAEVTEAQPPPGLDGPPPAGGAYARLRVEDQGPGIALEVLPRIFEPFFTTKGIGVGTGLGLSVTWGIVREHRGWIEPSNLPGRGARFDVFLPLAGDPGA